MTILSARPVLTALTLAGAVMIAAAAHAGPEVTLYLTFPLGAITNGHVMGLRVDRSARPQDVRSVNPESPLNRRALADLQLGANTGLRLELARRLTWDINRQEMRPSAPDAHFTLRLPTREAMHQPSAAKATTDPSLSRLFGAALANPLQNQSWKPQVKGLAVEP